MPKGIPNKRYTGEFKQMVVKTMMRECEAARQFDISDHHRVSFLERVYLQEFEPMEHFRKELIEYIDYYNNMHIKARLKGLQPALHRL